MSALSTTYALTNGTTADASKVQQDITDIVNYVNASTIRTDGATSMAAALSLSGDPTSANHAVRKAYLDGDYIYAKGIVSTTYTASTPAVVKYGTVVTDLRTSGAYSASTGIYTVPKTGIYSVTMSIEPTAADIRPWKLQLVVTGTQAQTYTGPTMTPSGFTNGGTAGATTGVIQMHQDIYVASGDLIKPTVTVFGTNETVQLFGALTIAWLHN